MPHAPDTGERGYALIGVIWLLVFAGSVTALLLMRASDRMVEVRRQGDAVRARLALDGAPDAIAAERLFGAADSPWMTAGSHSIDMDGIQVTGAISAEEQRLDVNRATAEAIDGELGAAGVSRQTRMRALGHIAEVRAAGERIGSLGALAALMDEAQREAKSCLLEKMTAFGGRAQAFAAGQEPSQNLPPYALIRVGLSAPGGGTATAIMRSVPVGSTPVLLLDWKTGSVCS
jgi:hypothetical protein